MERKQEERGSKGLAATLGQMGTLFTGVGGIAVAPERGIFVLPSFYSVSVGLKGILKLCPLNSVVAG